MPRNCLQKQIIEGKIEGKREVTGRRRRRRRRRKEEEEKKKTKRLLDEIKETTAY